MAWFSAYDADPRQYVCDGVEYETYACSFLTGYTYSQTVYTISERYIGMTETAAVRDAATISSLHPTWNVSAVPENNGGGWSIRIQRQTIGAWVQI